MNNNIPNNGENNNTQIQSISMNNYNVNNNQGKELSETKKREQSENENRIKKLESESESYYDKELIENCKNIITDTNNMNNEIKTQLDQDLSWHNYNSDVAELKKIFLDIYKLIKRLGNGLEEKKNQIEEKIKECDKIKNIYKIEIGKLKEKIKNNKNKLLKLGVRFYNIQIDKIRELDITIDGYNKIYVKYASKIQDLIEICNKNKLSYSIKLKNKLYNTFLNHYSAKINNNSSKIIKINSNNSNESRLKKLINNREIVNDILKIFNKVTNIINTNPLTLKDINKFNPIIKNLEKKISTLKSDLEISINLFKNKVTVNITKLTNNIKKKTDELKDQIKKCIEKLIKSNIPGLENEYKKLNGLIDQLKGIDNNEDFKSIKSALNRVSETRINGNLDLVKEKLQDIINKLQLNLSNSGGIIDPNKKNQRVVAEQGGKEVENNNSKPRETQYRNIQNSNTKNGTEFIKEGSKISWKNSSEVPHFGTINAINVSGHTPKYKLTNIIINKNGKERKMESRYYSMEEMTNIKILNNT